MAYDQRLMEMWRALPVLEGDTLPRRSKVKSSYISSMLPNCWQLDWQAEDRMIIEYEGTEVDSMWGDTLTGEDYLASYSGEKKQMLLSFYSALFDARCGATIVRSIRRAGSQPYLLVTNFVPMLSKDGERRIIFGNSEMHGDYKESVGRLDFDSAEMVSAAFIDLGNGVPENEPFPNKTNSGATE
jgi:hypothetical protein